ncbi:MAG: hypothetical protein KAH22_09600 [Thiotrichaceae bacterium]|nr:hypothetical protein [Thiotrichaceae bacterium]
MNLAKTKKWFVVTEKHFHHWADKVEIPWHIIKFHLDDTMEKARTL